MAPTGWAMQLQRDFLQTHVEGFLAAQKGGSVKRFYESTIEAFFQLFPEQPDGASVPESNVMQDVSGDNPNPGSTSNVSDLSGHQTVMVLTNSGKLKKGNKVSADDLWLTLP